MIKSQLMMEKMHVNTSILSTVQYTAVADFVAPLPVNFTFSFVIEEKPKELPQSSLQKASSAETDCNDECSGSTEAEDTHSITPGMPTVSAFFSLAALAEVAAMENVHRSVSAAYQCCLTGFCVTALLLRMHVKAVTSESTGFVISFHRCFS